MEAHSVIVIIIMMINSMEILAQIHHPPCNGRSHTRMHTHTRQTAYSEHKMLFWFKTFIEAWNPLLQ